MSSLNDIPDPQYQKSSPLKCSKPCNQGLMAVYMRWFWWREILVSNLGPHVREKIMWGQHPFFPPFSSFYFFLFSFCSCLCRRVVLGGGGGVASDRRRRVSARPAERSGDSRAICCRPCIEKIGEERKREEKKDKKREKNRRNKVCGTVSELIPIWNGPTSQPIWPVKACLPSINISLVEIRNFYLALFLKLMFLKIVCVVRWPEKFVRICFRSKTCTAYMQVESSPNCMCLYMCRPARGALIAR